MEIQRIHEILSDTAYVRTGGSEEELRCAEYLQSICRALGPEARLEAFEVPMYRVCKARLAVDGVEYSCKGYFNSGSGEVRAELCYPPNIDEISLQKCRGKIVLVDGALGARTYRKLIKNGALGFISYNGDVHYCDRDIDQKELRELAAEEPRIPGVLIHAADAVELVTQERRMAEITLVQETFSGLSHNVILDLPGEAEEWVILSAHYDSTALSCGAYDNMSGCIGLLQLAEYFARTPHRYGLRFLWCGSEERGLLGSKAYCAQHHEELEKLLLNINLDMLGCSMGKFVGFATANEKSKHYLECAAAEEGFSMETRYGIRSSDSNSFADQGVPAISFARYAPGNTATIHNRYDTAAVVKPAQLLEDLRFITAFTRRLVTAAQFPLEREISDKIREDLDGYFHRK